MKQEKKQEVLKSYLHFVHHMRITITMISFTVTKLIKWIKPSTIIIFIMFLYLLNNKIDTLWNTQSVTLLATWNLCRLKGSTHDKFIHEFSYFTLSDTSLERASFQRDGLEMVSSVHLFCLCQNCGLWKEKVCTALYKQQDVVMLNSQKWIKNTLKVCTKFKSSVESIRCCL